MEQQNDNPFNEVWDLDFLKTIPVTTTSSNKDVNTRQNSNSEQPSLYSGTDTTDSHQLNNTLFDQKKDSDLTDSQIKRLKNTKAAKKSRDKARHKVDSLERDQSDLRKSLSDLRFKLAQIELQVKLSNDKVALMNQRNEELELRIMQYQNMLFNK
ncbi:hypothetical protein BC833DRAFT_618698 [Globomyces pollinis-pini]|nr:hypothetical protein BC833DRAFT_618698 [Globomyces pollinis-pini]